LTIHNIRNSTSYFSLKVLADLCSLHTFCDVVFLNDKFSTVTWLTLITLLILLLEECKLNQILKHPYSSYLEEHERRKMSRLWRMEFAK